MIAGRLSVTAEQPLDPDLTADDLRPYVRNALRCGRSGDASTCVWSRAVLHVRYVPVHAIGESGDVDSGPRRCISGSPSRSRTLLDRLPDGSRRGPAHGRRRIGDEQLAVLSTGVTHEGSPTVERALLLWGCGAVEDGATDGVEILLALDDLVAELGEKAPSQ